MTIRRPLIAGNWKMHKTPQETEEFIRGFLPRVKGVDGVDILIIPPYTSLDRAGRLIEGTSLLLGRVHWCHLGEDARCLWLQSRPCRALRAARAVR